MVTILLATYNGEKYLEELINSLINQTYKDIKIIIRDDGSTDLTNVIINNYYEIYPDIIEICPTTVPTGSAAGNFFKMLEQYRDDYLMFCDQDDVWLPDKIEKTLYKMKNAENKYGADTPLLVHTDLFVTDADLNKISNSFVKYQKLSPERTGLNELLMQNNITGCTVMLNRALQEKLFVLPYKCAMHDWWIGIVAAAFGKIEYLNSPTILYRQHTDNEVGAKNANNISYLIYKLKNIKATSEIYKTISLQAEFLAANYSSQLTVKQKNLLSAVSGLPKIGRIEKIKTIRKYKLYKNTFLRNLGQYLFI